MERNFTPKVGLCLLLTMSFLSSCSWLSSRKSLFGSEPKTKAKTNNAHSAHATTNDKPIEMVPKTEYDKLADKYENLLKKTRYQNDEAFKKTVPNFNGKDPADIVNDLNKAPQGKGELAETVDLFSGDKKGKTPAVIMPAGNKVVHIADDAEIENQIILLKRAETKLAQSRYDEALNILKQLEKSNVRQIRVRAKFLVGEMLFAQQDYDLSMQVFEEILQQDAFSGVVIKALGRLIVCSEKLKLKKKQEKYYSMLHDFFESA